MVTVPSGVPSPSDSSKTMGRDTKLERLQSTGHVMLLCNTGEEKEGDLEWLKNLQWDPKTPGSWSDEYHRAITAPQQGPSCCMGSSLESPPLNLHSLTLHRRSKRCSL